MPGKGESGDRYLLVGEDGSMMIDDSLMLRRLLILVLAISLVSCSGRGDSHRAKGGRGEMATPEVEAGPVREPAAAGPDRFYPSDPKRLAAQLDELLSNARPVEIDGDVLALIVPHAGYLYSGGVAAEAYKQIEKKDVGTVVLIGPSHHMRFPWISVYDSGYWQTPLGMVPIDSELAKDLISRNASIRSAPELHAHEHSLEVQVPFLQRVVDDLRIVPVMMGDQSPALCETLGRAVAGALGSRKGLVIASTDLYHGYSYEECRRIDATTVELMDRSAQAALAESLETGGAQACGGGPVVAVMTAAKLLGGKDVRVLEYTSSADITGQKTGWIVGYVSALVIGERASVTGGKEDAPRADEAEFALSEDERRELREIAWRAIEGKVRRGEAPPVAAASGRLVTKRGVFVTVKKHGQLRGCIGYIEPVEPLARAVSNMAVAAATGDPRFPPVSEAELRDLTYEITVLSPLERVTDPAEIKVGAHGLYIRKGGHAGLLLPQVAVEYGWDREEFLEHTCEKAGLPRDAWKEGAEIYIYSGEIF
jgi:AmmeMemoRadiSam system protein B/AmmeMemoRadiSam system protein A